MKLRCEGSVKATAHRSGTVSDWLSGSNSLSEAVKGVLTNSYRIGILGVLADFYDLTNCVSEENKIDQWFAEIRQPFH